MLRIQLPGVLIGITFRHSKANQVLPQSVKDKKDGKPVRCRETMASFCEIHEIEGIHQKFLAEGSTYVGVGDQFKRAEGRKISLTRALKLLTAPKRGEKSTHYPPLILSKGDRELIWSVYNSQRKVRVTIDDVKLVLRQDTEDVKELIDTLREMLEVKVEVKDGKIAENQTV